MSASNITGDSRIRKILESACASRELLFLVTPYLRFETNFLALETDAFQARITMSAEEANFGLRSAELRFRFPYSTRFLEGHTSLLGFGLQEGRRTLRLALPKTLQDDEQRRSYRVERVGKVPVTFSTPKFDLKAGTLVNISTAGVRLLVAQEPLANLLRTEDSIAVSLTLTEGIQINHRAVVRWIQGKTLGVEFQPTLDPQVLTLLSRWVFQRREEDKDRVGSYFVDAAPQGEPAPGMVLVSSSQEMEDDLRALLAELPPLQRVGPSVPSVKAAIAGKPALIFFHIQDPGLDGRKRLKMLVEVLGGRIPFVLLGTQVENSVLFDLGTEHKAAAVYDLGSKPGSFFLRLVRGILRQHPAKAQGS